MSKKSKKPARSHAVSAREQSARKRAVVLGPPKKNRLPALLVASAAALITAGGIYYLTATGKEPSGAIATNASFDPATNTLSYNAADFDDGRARHYAHNSADGVKVKYFILKSSDGVIRAAFDACDVCWPAGKGYYQSGDFMVCRNCGRQFASVLVNEVKGGCNPAPLNRTIVDGRVVLKVTDIEEGGHLYFDFSRKG